MKVKRACCNVYNPLISIIFYALTITSMVLQIKYYQRAQEYRKTYPEVQFDGTGKLLTAIILAPITIAIFLLADISSRKLVSE